MNNNNTDGLFFSLNSTKKISLVKSYWPKFSYTGERIITLKMYCSLLALTVCFLDLVVYQKQQVARFIGALVQNSVKMTVKMYW